MESTAIKMFLNLISGMTVTETFSLVIILGMAVIFSIRGTLKFVDFVQKNKQIEQTSEAKHKHHQLPTSPDLDQIILQLNVIRDKLISMEMKSVETRFEMPKELQKELEHIVKTIDEQHDLQLDGQKNILKMISSLEDLLVTIKEKLILIEQQLPSLKSDSKDVMKEVNQNVQSIAKDIATLQGTILGNFSTRNSR